MSSLEVIVLAAGKGTRMRSALPKVLHPLAGKPMLQHVVDTCQKINADKVHVVIGHGAELVQQTLQANATNEHVQWALQAEQKGTGHAVAQAIDQVDNNAKVLVLYGDVPLTKPETLTALIDRCAENCYGMLTVNLDDPTGYGRIVRDQNGAVQRIVEQKDASPQELAITEINTGIAVGWAADFKAWLPQLSNSNAQGEYYLTDLIEMAVAAGRTISVEQPSSSDEVEGVNSRLQLADLERSYQRAQADVLMTNGASLADPNRIDVRGEITTGQDVSIDINCVFEGRVHLQDNVSIGANCIIKDSTIGEGTVILPNSMVDSSEVSAHCNIGPYARLRPGSVLHKGAKVGNFVETKKAEIGEGSKVNHLAYIGDAEIGSGVNVGAGTITCNYDGVNKHKTILGDGVFVGSNATLVAPLTIAKDGFVGAGSTITKNVDGGELAVGRGKQRNIGGWQRPQKPKS